MKEIIIRINIENGTVDVKNNYNNVTQKQSLFEDFKKVYLSNPKTNKSELAKIFNVSRQAIYLWVEKINKNYFELNYQLYL